MLQAAGKPTPWATGLPSPRPLAPSGSRQMSTGRSLLSLESRGSCCVSGESPAESGGSSTVHPCSTESMSPPRYNPPVQASNRLAHILFPFGLLHLGQSPLSCRPNRIWPYGPNGRMQCSCPEMAVSQGSPWPCARHGRTYNTRPCLCPSPCHCPSKSLHVAFAFAFELWRALAPSLRGSISFPVYSVCLSFALACGADGVKVILPHVSWVHPFGISSHIPCGVIPVAVVHLPKVHIIVPGLMRVL